MELRRYFDLILRWAWLIVLSTLLAGGSAYFVSKRLVPVYQASATLLVDQSKQATTDYTSIMTSERLTQTYAEWFRKRPVLDEVISQLQLPVKTKELADAIKVTPVRNTQLLVVSVEDTDPARAAAIANLLPEIFRQQSASMQSQRFTSAKSGVEEQLAQVRADSALAQAALKQTQAEGNAAETERLQGSLRELQTSEASLAKSLADIRLEEAKTIDNLFAIERAEAPTRPIRPRTSQNTLLAAVVGAMLALGVIFLVEYLDDVVKDPDDVQAALGLTTLGAVPVVESNGVEPGLVTLASGHSAATEAYRVLRTNLQFAAVGRSLRSLLITSASPSEGKSSTSANLAIALAQGGRRVILVDCDLHRPRLHRLLKLRNNLGLTTALVEPDVDLASLLQPYEVPGLQVMTSGPLAPNPAEILGTVRMRAVLAGLVEIADMVIVDSPPILAVADAAILASELDGVLIVLDAGTTRREIAQRGLASLQQVQAAVIGAVLNRVPRRRSGYYYYYYYNHDYNTDGNSSRGGERRRWPWQKAGRRRAPEVALPGPVGK